MAERPLLEHGAIGADADGDDIEGADVEERVAVVDSAQHGERLDKALVAIAPEFSRTHLQQLIKDGWVTVDGAAAPSAAQRVRAGQRIAVRLAADGGEPRLPRRVAAARGRSRG